MVLIGRDKLSSYMETMGATGQPGLLILTTGLSKVRGVLCVGGRCG